VTIRVWFAWLPRTPSASRSSFEKVRGGSKHPGIYNVYQYRFALDATKTVASLTLPKTVNVVTLAISLEP
jgi:hypothetical protein